MIQLFKKLLLIILRKNVRATMKSTPSFMDVVTPMKPSIYHEIQEVSENFHDLMLKTARFIKINSNLLPLTGISHSEMQFLSGIPTTTLLSMSGSVRYGVDASGAIKILDFRPGGLLEFSKISKLNNVYCKSKSLSSSCLDPEVILGSWFRHVVNGYKQYTPVHNCALITTCEEELKMLAPICKKVGLNIICTELGNMKIKNKHMYVGKEKIDIIVRTPAFYEMTKSRGVLHDILETMQHKNIITINPIEEFIANSRSLQALAWYMHETNQFYTQDEHDFIEKYMIPTYIVPREDGPLWLLQYYGDDVVRLNSFDEVTDSMMEEGGLVYQYRGDHDYTHFIESYLIGNKAAGCVYVSHEGRHEYTFIAKK